MPESKSAVLITGSRAPCALVLARTLHNAGFRVYTADSLRPNLCEGSEAVEADFLIPSPRFHPNQCIDELNRLVAKYRISALIPTCEEIYHLSAARPRLAGQLRCFFPSLPTLDRLHNKYSCIELASQLGLRVPATKLLKSRTDLDKLNWEHDAILKRVYSRFSSHVVPLPGSAQQRQMAARRVFQEDGNHWIHQQFIRGRSLCSYSLCQDGKIIHHTAYTTPYTVGLGAGIYYESADSSPSLNAAQRLAAASGFTGQLSLDFIENEQGLWLLECNPRATMGLALAAGNAAFARAWKVAIGEDPDKSSTSPGATSIPITPPGLRRQMSLAMLFYGWKGRSAGHSLYRWAHDLFTTPDVLLCRKDPGVLLRQLKALSSYAWRARAMGTPVVPFTTHDIEWNGVAEGVRV